MSTPKYPYIVPRSFRLRQELEFAEKGTPMTASDSKGKGKDPHAGFITFGLDDTITHDSVQNYAEQLADWNGCIIGPQNTAIGERMYSVRIRCGPRYPAEPPQVTFVHRISMSGVNDQSGLCDSRVFVPQWTRELGIYDYLVAIRQSMPQASRLKQPPQESTYQ